MSALWTDQEVQHATNGQANQTNWQATGFATDTRVIQPGDLFIALKGPLHDGHDFVEEALAKGAVAAIVHKEYPQNYSVVRVQDTLKALNDLGFFARERTGAKVVAVTGSFGKTSTKEALRLVLSHQSSVAANERSFNNFWGVPLSLAQLPRDYAYGVFEIGMNYPNEITPLSKLAKPSLAIITTIEKMHIENCGGYEGVADAKSEIFEGMAAGSPVVLKMDNPMFERTALKARAKGLEVFSFGKNSGASSLIHKAEIKNGLLHIELDILGQAVVCDIPMLGDHWAYNSAAILTAVSLLGGDVVRAARSLESFSLLEGRGAVQKLTLKSGGTITVLDESYNAGPGSMRAAIQTLGRLDIGPGGRRIAVLGDMVELGDDALELHMGLKKFLVENDIDLVYATGSCMKKMFETLPKERQGEWCEQLDDLVASVVGDIKPGDSIMVKGSRGQRAYHGRMSKVVNALREQSICSKKSA